jgi:hypothetical protein
MVLIDGVMQSHEMVELCGREVIEGWIEMRKKKSEV